MSHEIRTPLNGVLGMAQAMAGDPLSDVQRQRLDVIRQSGTVLMTLLNDLLDMAKIEAAKLELEDGCLDIDEMARQTQEAFVALAADKDIELRVTVASDLAGFWRADPVRVRQILYNLLSNAVKFTDRGSVSALLDLDAAGYVRIRVQDTGPDITDVHLVNLFSRFVQGDSSTTRRFGGTGLGQHRGSERVFGTFTLGPTPPDMTLQSPEPSPLKLIKNVPAYESEGRTFESFRARHFLPDH